MQRPRGSKWRAGLGTALAAAAGWALLQVLQPLLVLQVLGMGLSGRPAQAAAGAAQQVAPGAPSAQAPRPDPAARPAFKLSVAGGSGSGDFAPHAVTHIWADPPPAGSVFERWAGDVTPLIDRQAAHTTVVMPRTPLAVQALFKPAPGCTPVTENLHGVETTWCLPAGHKALILAFHGHEGSGAGFFRATEPRIFAGDAAAAGFGLIALDSADRDHKSWNPRAGGRAANADLENVRFVLAALARRRAIDSHEPLFGLGVAQGGTFAVHAAHALQLRAVAVFGSPAGLPLDYATPTVWLTTQTRDQESQGGEQIDPGDGGSGGSRGSGGGHAGRGGDRTPRALAEYSKLAQRHVAAKLEVNDPSPVYPLRFWRIAGVNAETSGRIHRLLVDRGYLDAHDQLKEDPETSGWEVALPPRLAKIRFALREQLDVCFGVPRFYSDFDHRILDFFQAQP